MYGGYSPFPKRYGGGRPRLRIIHDALNAARGTALDASNSSTVAWVENMALARAICFDGFGTNDRLSLQWDPDRMTDMLPRWEQILKLTPAPDADETTRRAEVRKRWERFIHAAALHSRVLTVLKEALGDVFVAVEYISYANANIHVPDASYPWGTVVTGILWTSTVAHVLVLLQRLPGYTDGDFYEQAAKVHLLLDGLLPAWCTVDWYHAPINSPAITVSGGPSRAGFYLDDEHNLDWSVFDV